MKPLIVFAMSVLLGLGLNASQASAEDRVRLLPGGVVYPEYNSEGVTNPGTLSEDDARVFRVLVDANIFGSSTQAVGVDYTLTRPTFGLDIGYDTSRTVFTGSPASTLSHVVHGAAGYRLGALGIGLSYTHDLSSNTTSSISTTSTGVSGQLDMGMVYSLGSGRAALVVSDLGGSPSAILGIGVLEKQKYVIELNLGLPAFSDGFTTSGSSYDLLLATSIYLGKIFGIGYRTTYSYVIGTAAGVSSSIFIDTPLGFSHSFSLLLRVTENGSLTFRFDPSDYLTLGITFRI